MKPNRSIQTISWKQICRPKSTGGLGILNLLAWRQSICAALAASVIKNDSHWCAVLLARHDPYSINRPPSGGFSCGWKMLKYGWRLANRLVVWKVGNGCSIRALDNNWLGLPISQLPSATNTLHNPSCRLSEYRSDQGWSLPDLIRDFGERAISMIDPSASDMEDSTRWSNDINPLSVCGSIYSLLCDKAPCL